MNFVSRKTIVNKLLKSKKFRDAYVDEHIKRMIPFSLRTMRDERVWSQAEAGQALGKPQNVISRLESPAYGKLTLQTLLEIAHGYDVGLLIKFVPFSRLVKEHEDVSAEALSAKSVSDEKEVAALEEWVAEDDESDDSANVATVSRLTDTSRFDPINMNCSIAPSRSEIKGQLEFPFKAIRGVPNVDTQHTQRPSVTTTQHEKPMALRATGSTR